jgi:hypothetical protein
MSAGTGFFGFSGASTAAIQDQARAASYTVQNDPRANALYDFLGMPNRAIPAEIASHRPRTNETLLDAYKGRNALLSDTIDGLVLSDNEPETLIIFPWMQTDEKNFKYNTIEFNRALPGPTPHEGTSRLLTSSHSSKSFTTQRRGIKFRLEGDFAATAQGQGTRMVCVCVSVSLRLIPLLLCSRLLPKHHRHVASRAGNGDVRVRRRVVELQGVQQGVRCTAQGTRPRVAPRAHQRVRRLCRCVH